MTIGYIDDRAPTDEEIALCDIGVRTTMLGLYDVGRSFYTRGLALGNRNRKSRCATFWTSEVGCLLWYGCQIVKSHRRRTEMNVEEMAAKWHAMVVGLATAHTKDEADRYEASVNECLEPILKAPVKQLRQLATLLRDSLKGDSTVPYLVWRGMEMWIDKIVLLAPDEGVKELKTALAKEIVDLVEEDAKRDLREAMVNALQWRPAEKLEEVKAVIVEEKAKGNTTRLKGRESCLFLEAGGTLEQPKVCVQV